MKFTVLLLIACVSAVDPGTPCSFQPNECGDNTKFCCGIATKGLMCEDKTCGSTVSTAPAPNVVVCNNRKSGGTSPVGFEST